MESCKNEYQNNKKKINHFSALEHLLEISRPLAFNFENRAHAKVQLEAVV